MKTPYEILGVSAYTSLSDIKKKFIELSKLHHPDNGGSEEKFIELYNAYSKIKNNPPQHLTIKTQLITTDKELLDILGKEYIVEYEHNMFSVTLPFNARIGDTVHAKISENVSIKIQIVKQKDDQ